MNHMNIMLALAADDASAPFVNPGRTSGRLDPLDYEMVRVTPGNQASHGRGRAVCDPMCSYDGSSSAVGACPGSAA